MIQRNNIDFNFHLSFYKGELRGNDGLFGGASSHVYAYPVGGGTIKYHANERHIWLCPVIVPKPNSFETPAPYISRNDTTATEVDVQSYLRSSLMMTYLKDENIKALLHFINVCDWRELVQDKGDNYAKGVYDITDPGYDPNRFDHYCAVLQVPNEVSRS